MSRRRPSWVVAFSGFAAGLLAIAFLSSGIRPAVGQPKPLVIPPAPQAPTLTTPANFGAKAGDSVELTLSGTNLADPVAVLLSCPGKVSIPTDNKNGTEAAKLRVKVELPADCPIGLHTLRVATKQGVSNFRPFVVDELPVVPEADGNRTKDAAQAVTLPAVVTGRTDAEASDFFKVKVAPGQTLTFEVLARRIGSPLDPIVVLHDAKTKRELVDLYADDTPGLQSDCRLTHTFKEGGEFLVEVRDTTYRGGADFFYRLRIGDFPGVTTAFPVAMQRGQVASVGFAGPNAADLPAVSLKVPADPTLPVVYVAPKRSALRGWPVPVRVSDRPETAEAEPNNEAAKANKLAVPGGVSGRFDKTGDVDHFSVACKKGVKYAAAATTFELNSPCEVLLRVLDAKGAEVGRSNPSQPGARVEFTPAADGDYVVACEQLNYLSGPNEIYHLAVAPVAPDIGITLSADRGDAAPGSGTAVAATVTRLNGYAGPVELSIVGDAGLSGSVTVPAGQAGLTFVPLMVKDGTKPGAYAFRVQGKITVDGAAVVRTGTLIDPVKATLGGMPNPPLEMLGYCALGVTEKPAFTLKLSADPVAVEKGKTSKAVFDAVRDAGADGDIAVAPLSLPANVTAAAAKPIAKGQTKTDLVVTVAPAAAAGKTPLVFRATTKVGGKDYALIPPPLVLDVTEPKKAEPKKEEPKKDKK